MSDLIHNDPFLFTLDVQPALKFHSATAQFVAGRLLVSRLFLLLVVMWLIHRAGIINAAALPAKDQRGGDRLQIELETMAGMLRRANRADRIVDE